MFHQLKVGAPYLPGKSRIAPFTNYNFRAGTHELLLVMDSLSQKEIEAVRHGEAEFALTVHERIIFLLYRFEGGFQWSDAPFSIWLVKEAERRPPDRLEAPESRAMMHAVLVDADRNLTQAFRVLSLSPTFSAKLHGAIADQLRQQISIKDYESAIESAYSKWLNTMDMLNDSVARCKGGA